MNNYINKIKPHITKANVAALLLLAVIYSIIGCPILFFTGISCPGCGMSRAILQLIQFNFSRAAYYHPLVFILPFIIIIYCFVLSKAGKIARLLFVLFVCMVFLGVYLWRMFAGDGVIVKAGTPAFWILINNVFRRISA